MAHTLHLQKNGRRVYEIRVSGGRDSKTGKKLSPCSMTWPVPEELSPAEAEKKAEEIEEEFRFVLSGISRQDADPFPGIITFQKYADRYLREIRSAHAASTMAKYQGVFRKACERFGSRPIADITKEMMKEYFCGLQMTYSHSTVCTHFKVLGLLFRSAWEEELIRESPMLHLKAPRCSKDKVSLEDKAYSKEEVSRILTLMENESLLFRTMVYFLLDTGCRRGEAAGLKWENIDMETGKIRICNNLQYLSSRGKYMCTPKSGQLRTVILSRRVLEIIQTWHEHQTASYASRGLPLSPFVFTDKAGGPMYPDTISRMFRRFGRKHGIRRFHPHALRHTMATLSILNGADVVSVSKKLGHSSPSVTLNVYSHTNEEALKKAGEILADAIYR